MVKESYTFPSLDFLYSKRREEWLNAVSFTKPKSTSRYMLQAGVEFEKADVWDPPPPATTWMVPFIVPE